MIRAGTSRTLTRNHFQAKNLALSTTGSSEWAPPTKTRSFLEVQMVQITACQTRIRPNLTLFPPPKPEKAWKC